MFQFKWQTPAPTPQEIVLEIHSRSGWFGRKILKVGDTTIFRRGHFQGIEQRFRAPGSGEVLSLRMIRIADTPNWRPALFRGDGELPERTGTHPPQLAERPKVLSVTVGITYLFMLMAAVMLPSIVRILGALYGSDESYSPSQDIVPSIIPFLATAVCLLGYWNMRKWGVYLYAFIIALQGFLGPTGAMPIGATALLLEIILLSLGLVYLGKMQ